MNNVFPVDESDIGTDPTLIEVVDSLDILPEQNSGEKGKKKKKNKTSNPDKKNGSVLKKILFTIVILALMGGVSYGLYFYLSLGKTVHKDPFTLNAVQVYVGGTLSSNVLDYGSFNGIDIATCTISGLDAVDVNTVGTYEYSITCGKNKMTSSIEIINKPEIAFSTNIVYKTVSDIPNVSEFVNSLDTYDLLTDEELIKEYLTKTGGPYGISISIKDTLGSKKTGYAALYVIKDKASASLKCTSKEDVKENYTSSQTDYFIFDDNKSSLGNALRLYNYKYNTDEDYENILTAVKDNKLKIDGHEGYFIMNTSERVISIINKLTNTTLKNEYKDTFPTSYDEINTYYKDTKEYSCIN